MHKVSRGEKWSLIEKHWSGVWLSDTQTWRVWFWIPIPADSCEDYLSIFILLNSDKIIQSVFTNAYTHVTHTPMKT